MGHQVLAPVSSGLLSLPKATLHHGGGGASPQFGYATPPPPPSLPSGPT